MSTKETIERLQYAIDNMAIHLLDNVTADEALKFSQAGKNLSSTMLDMFHLEALNRELPPDTHQENGHEAR